MFLSTLQTTLSWYEVTRVIEKGCETRNLSLKSKSKGLWFWLLRLTGNRSTGKFPQRYQVPHQSTWFDFKCLKMKVWRQEQGFKACEAASSFAASMSIFVASLSLRVRPASVKLLEKPAPERKDPSTSQDSCDTCERGWGHNKKMIAKKYQACLNSEGFLHLGNLLLDWVFLPGGSILEAITVTLMTLNETLTSTRLPFENLNIVHEPFWTVQGYPWIP